MDTNYLKRVLLFLLSILLSALLVAYAGYHLWHSITSKVTTLIASPHTVSVSIVCDGYIMRDETLVYSKSADGKIVPYIDDGVRVARNDKIAGVYRSAKPDTAKKLAEVEEQINLLSESISDSNISVKDAKRLDGEIYSVLKNIHANIESNSYSDVLSLKRGLISLINKRLIVTGDGGDLAELMDNLENEAAKLKKELGSPSETLTSSITGWYYSNTDGYENIYTSSAAKSMTYDEFTRMKEASPDDISDKCAGKIATDYIWHLACNIDESDAKEMEVGHNYTVAFLYNQGCQIEMTLDRLIEGDNGYAAVLTTGEILSGFDFHRMQSVEIVKREYTGFKIPLSAVRMNSEHQGVYVLEGTTVYFRKIKVLLEHETYYIVDTNPENDGEPFSYLSLNENIIVEGKGMYDGRIIAK